MTGAITRATWVVAVATGSAVLGEDWPQFRGSGGQGHSGREFKKIAANRVDGQTLASIAVSGGALFLRTATRLYRIKT